MDAAVAIGQKRCQPETDFSKCMICQCGPANAPLQRLTPQGYPSLLYAVENRDDEISFRLLSHIRSKEVLFTKETFYHAKCRNSYTNKKTVDQMKRKIQKTKHETNQPGSSTEDPDSIQLTTRSIAADSIDYKRNCFICEKCRDKSGTWALILVSTVDRQHAVWQKANDLSDEDMLNKIRGLSGGCIDMIAYDFRYHRTCMNTYLNIKDNLVNPSCQDQNIYTSAFSDLVAAIDQPLREGRVYYVTTLRNQYRSLLAKYGDKDASSYRSFCLLRRLQNYYTTKHGCSVITVPQKGTSSLLCSSDLSISRLLSEVMILKDKLDESEYTEESEDESDNLPNRDAEQKTMSFHTAKHLRAELKHFGKTEKEQLKSYKDAVQSTMNVEHPPSNVDMPTMDISYEAASTRVTDNLYNHIAWLFTDANSDIEENGRVSLKQRQHEQVLNLAQDITSSVASIPTPKQVGAAIHVLKETRSKNTLTLFNRLGNCISYQDTQRYIATMAKEAEDQIAEDGFFMPTDLKPGRFCQYAIDNLDFHEHTKDGTTLHATTHNIYQYLDEGEEAIKMGGVPLVKLRKASIKDPQSFYTKQSNLTLKERRQSRSLAGMDILMGQSDDADNPLENSNIVWQLLQMGPTNIMGDNTSSDDFIPPTWSVFNDRLISEDTKATVISYGPIFPESPTNPDVVEQSLDYCMNVSNKLAQEFTVITCDQAIYEIALALERKRKDKYSKLIIRMGGFHIASNFMGAIGFFMKNSGIEDVLVDAGICLRGTANKLMSGKDYYGMLRAHSLVHTAMFHLHWEAFEHWLIEENKGLDEIAALSHSIQLVSDAFSDGERRHVASDCLISTTEPLEAMKQLLDEFDQSRCTSPTSKLWLMYMDMVRILKRYIQAERAGLWEVHISETENMLAYMVAAGHHKYVACLPHYLTAMRSLPTTAPDVHLAFMDGKFTVRKNQGRFNGVWSDMGLEQTYNREAKSNLFHGITQNVAAMEKYLRALPMLTAISEKTKLMTNMDQDHDKHHEDSSELARKECDASRNVYQVIDEKMVNPFTCESTDLINISTGEKAVSRELVNAKEIGLKAIATAQDKGSDKVEIVKLQTFATNRARKSQTNAEKAKKIYEEESAVIRNLYFVQELDETKKKEVFSHEWTTYPASLFEPAASLSQGYAMRKGNKADYLNGIKAYLGDLWKSADSLPNSDVPTVLIIDAMAFIQRYQHLGSSTFGELQAKYMKKLISTVPDHCDCIHFVGDRYDVPPSQSLKGEEREKRENTSQSKGKEYEPCDSFAIPPWKEFVQNPKNKANLLNYLGLAWAEYNEEQVPVGISVILGGILDKSGKTIQVSSDRVVELPELSCEKHEEADTRMFAHIAYCVHNLGYKRAIIEATDTDVIVLGLYYCNRIGDISEMWIHKMDTFLPLHDISKTLAMKAGTEVSLLTSILLSAYILSGCDTVSYPYRRGKRRALKVALEKTHDLLPLGQYSESDGLLDIDETIVQSARLYFMALYGKADFSGNLDDLRAHLFATTKGDLRCLPPTEDAFQQHLLRGLHQIVVSKNAHNPLPEYPDAKLFGRKVINDKLVPVMMLKSPKPTEVQRHNYCGCRKDKCLTRRCICVKAGVKCVIACQCTAHPSKCGRVRPTIEDSDSD